MRRLHLAALPLCLLSFAGGLSSQERIVEKHAAAVGMSYEVITFSGDGLLQPELLATGDTRIRSIRQLTIPVSLAASLGDTWHVDLTTMYGSGDVHYSEPDGTQRTLSLSGMSDIRLRATGPFFRDGLIFTFGANLPTGTAALDREKFAALRVIAAPALGLRSTPVGSGPSGTAGVVVVSHPGSWTSAAGVSYEYRGEYQPVAAIAAGAPSADFQPGAVLRASVAADRSVGQQRLSLAVAADIFQTDRLKSPAAPGSSSETADVASVKLGPVLSADAQLQVAAPWLNQLLIYSSYRYRTPFARDGVRIGASSASYLESGLRGARSVATDVEAELTIDGRWHSGLGIDQGLPTYGVTSIGATLGANIRRGAINVQPYLRGQSGALRRSGVATTTERQGFGGASFGLIIVSRF